MLSWLLLLAVLAHADRSIPLSSPTRAVLPNGLSLTVEDGALYVERGDVRALVPLPEDRAYRSPAKSLAELSGTDNRAWVTVKWTDVCGFDDQLQVKLNTLYARVEAESAVRLLKDKAVDQAISRLTRAVQLDADFDAATESLAGVYLAAGRAQDALDTVEPLIVKQPAKVYLDAVLDPRLNALLSTPRVAGLVAAAPGTAQLTAASVQTASQEFAPGKLAAYEPGRKLVAAVERVIEGGGEDGSSCPWRSTLHVVEAKTGRVLAKLPLVTLQDTASSKSCLKPGPVTGPAAKRVAERVALANRALSALGFIIPEQAKALAAPRPQSPPDNPSIQYTELSFPSDNLHLLAYSDGHAELKRADLEVDRAERVERANWAVHIPEARLVVYQWGQFPSEGCPKNVAGGIGVLKP